MIRIPLLCLVLAALAAPPAGAAQRRVPSPFAQEAAPPSAAPGAVVREDGRSTALLMLGGVVGGGVGLIGGMAVGSSFDTVDENCIDFCFGAGLILGALAGEAAGAALGVHLANRGHGNLPAGALASGLILVAGLFAASEQPMVLLALPALQLGGIIAVERATQRDR